MEKKSKRLHLPERGSKKLVPDNDSNLNQLCDERVKKNLDHHKFLLENYKTKNSRSIAIWDDDKKLAFITKQTGKMFRYFGKQTKNSYTLLPEEALYLLEMNYLILLHQEYPLSIQHAYSIILDHNTYNLLSNYRIYAKLLRDGYRVIRYQNEKNVIKQEEGSSSFHPRTKKPKTEINSHTTPLINCQLNESTDLILEKLNIFKTSSDNKNKSPVYQCYYPHNKLFIKSAPPKPDLVVDFARTSSEVESSVKTKDSSVKHIIALEASKDIFYNVSNVNIKNLFEK